MALEAATSDQSIPTTKHSFSTPVAVKNVTSATVSAANPRIALSLALAIMDRSPGRG